MNDTIFAVSGPGISRTLFHLIFFNNALKYIISPPFQRSRNGFESWNDLPKVMEWVNGEFGMAWWPWSPHPLTLAMAGYSLLKHLMQDCEILEEWELQRRMVGHNKDNKVWIGEYRESRTVEGGRQRQDPTGWVWGVCVEGEGRGRKLAKQAVCVWGGVGWGKGWSAWVGAWKLDQRLWIWS